MSKELRKPRFFKQSDKKKAPLETLTLEIERLSHDGRGIAKHQGKTVFVSGALPGETVEAKQTEVKSRFSSAQTQQVLKASADRVEPICPYVKHCGGCELQHFKAEKQIAFKQEQALDQLQRTAHIQPAEIAAPLDAAPWNYRRRARLSVYSPRSKSEPVLGFRRRNDKQLVAIDHCAILAEPLNALIPPLKQWLESCATPQNIGHIELIDAEPKPAIVLRTTRPLEDKDLASLRTLCGQLNTSYYLQTDQGLNNEDLLHYSLSAHKLKLTFAPNDFTQINPAINTQMVQQALDWLAPQANDKILDLFCGLGNFSLPLALHAQHVTGIEGSATMIERAINNAKLNNLSNTAFRKCDLNEPNIKVKEFDKILLDPPRAGAQAVVEQLAKGKADILYVSCDPATFARDAGILIEGGYKLEKWGVMNMFPHTTHVESMGLFRKKRQK